MEHGLIKYSSSPQEIVSKYMEIYYGNFPSSRPKAPQRDKKISDGLAKSNSYAIDNTLIYPTEYKSDFPGVNRYGSNVGLIAGTAITDLEGKQKSIFYIGEDVILSIK